MFTTHCIKLKEQYCDPIFSGDKTFEVRINDRGYQKGDHIQFMPVNDNGKFISHAVVSETYVITYVHSGYGLKEDYVVLGIKNIEEISDES